MTDVVLNVRQIYQYPAETLAGSTDAVLVQSGVGAPYNSITAPIFVSTALLDGSALNLKPGSAICWDGGRLTYQSGIFSFNGTISAPTISAGSIVMDGQVVATEGFVTGILDSTPVVNSFNGRTGEVQLETVDILRAGAAPVANPSFAGVCTAPTPWNFEAADDTIATTAWVQGALCRWFETGRDVGAFVTSFNGRGGAVILGADDITSAATAPNARARANNPSLGDYSNRIATTAFVSDAVGLVTTGFAPINSPHFTGVPTAPQPPASSNSNQIATTAFVDTAVAGAIKMSGATAININTLTGGIPLVGDGATDNYNALIQIPNNMYNLNQEWPVAVTLSSGTGGVCVVTWPSAHNLKPNQAFFFTVAAGGSLPTGITVNTPYFVTFANLTATTFTFSTVNNTMLNGPNQIPGVEGTPLQFSGSPSGVSVVLTGKDWINIYVPPGCYATHLPFGSATDRRSAYLFPAGISKVRMLMYGAVFDDLVVPSPSTYSDSWGVPLPGYLPGWTPQWYDFIVNIYGGQVGSGPNQITIKTPANAGIYYYPGQWILLMSMDVQNDAGKLQSGPPNNFYSEYNQVTSVNASTGVINLKFPIRQIYVSTLPAMWNGAPGTGSIGGGRAMIIPMSSAWDIEYEIVGGRFPIAEPGFQGRRTVFVDCRFDVMMGSTASREVIYRNCYIGQSTQIDKLMEYLEFDNCEGYFSYVSGPVGLMSTIKKCRGQIYGTPRYIQIDDCLIDQFTIGNIGYGCTDSVVIRNTRVSNFIWTQRNDGPGFGYNSYGSNQLASWSFSNGTLTRDLSTVPQANTYNTWAVSGAKMFLSDEMNQYENMGSPFAVLNVYMTGTAIVFPAVANTGAGSGGTPGAVVLTLVGGTGTAATINGTINSSGQLVGPLTVATGGNYTVFPASPASVSGGGLTGATVTFVAGGLFHVDTTLRAIPTSQVITSGITAVNGAATTFTGATIANGTPVILQIPGGTTGTAVLPTGINQFANYWVVNTSANTFQLASTYNGAAIVGTGTPSGTYNVVVGALHITPHPCPRFTGIGNFGTGQGNLTDLNGAIDEPIFSRFKRVFSGFQYLGDISSQQPYPRIWGNLVTMTVNVLQPAAGVTAGAAKVTITCPGFVQPTVASPTLTLATMTQVIDLTVAGIRTITQTTATGPAGTADTIAAYPNWLTSGQAKNPSSTLNAFHILCSGTPAKTNLANQAVFSVEVITDQGITRFASNYAGDTLTSTNAGGLANALVDTSVVQMWAQNQSPTNVP